KGVREGGQGRGSEGSFFDHSDPLPSLPYERISTFPKSILSDPVVLEGVTDAAVKSATQRILQLSNDTSDHLGFLSLTVEQIAHAGCRAEATVYGRQIRPAPGVEHVCLRSGADSLC